MPSPRSILIDIEKHGLDPNVAHTNVGADGRLRGPVVTHEESVKPRKESKQHLKSGLVELPENEKDDVTSESDIADKKVVAVADETTSTSEDTPVDGPTKSKKEWKKKGNLS